MRWFVLFVAALAALLLAACTTGNGADPPSSPVAPTSTALGSTPTKASNGPPLIPHTLSGRAECLVCHQKGIGGAPGVSASHEGRTNDVCTLCHKTAGGASPTATAASSTPVPGQTPAKTPTGQTASPPGIPHTLVGRTECLLCHGPNGLKPVPANHAGRANNTCTLCHRSSGGASPTVTSIAGTPVSPQTPVATPTKARETEAPPSIPHTLVGRTECLLCHGPNGLKPVPANHTGRANDMCTLCHRPSGGASPTVTSTAGRTPVSPQTPAATPTRARETEAPPSIPHTLVGRSECLLCHGPGGLKPAPANHAGRTNDTCTACHKPLAGTLTPSPTSGAASATPGKATVTPMPPTVAPTAATQGPPNIPHSLAGRSECLQCHGSGGVKPAPANHAGRTNTTCTLCHKPAA